MATFSTKMNVLTAIELLDLEEEEKDIYNERINQYYGERPREQGSADEYDDSE